MNALNFTLLNIVGLFVPGALIVLCGVFGFHLSGSITTATMIPTDPAMASLASTGYVLGFCLLAYVFGTLLNEVASKMAFEWAVDDLRLPKRPSLLRAYLHVIGDTVTPPSSPNGEPTDQRLTAVLGGLVLFLGAIAVSAITAQLPVFRTAGPLVGGCALYLAGAGIIAASALQCVFPPTQYPVEEPQPHIDRIFENERVTLLLASDRETTTQSLHATSTHASMLASIFAVGLVAPILLVSPSVFTKLIGGHVTTAEHVYQALSLSFDSFGLSSALLGLTLTIHLVFLLATAVTTRQLFRRYFRGVHTVAATAPSYPHVLQGAYNPLALTRERDNAIATQSGYS